jgi:hypothetical protein
MKRASLVTLSVVMLFIFSAASANASWFTLQGNWKAPYPSMLLSVKDKKRDDGERKNSKNDHHDGNKHGKKHHGDGPDESSSAPSPAPAGRTGDPCSEGNVLIGDYCQQR